MSYYPTPVQGLGLIAGALQEDLPEAWPTVDGLIRRSIPGWIEFAWPYIQPRIETLAPTIIDQQWPNIDYKIRQSMPGWIEYGAPYAQTQAPAMLDAVWPTVQQRISEMVVPLATAMVPDITDQVANRLGPQLPSMITDALIADAVNKSVETAPKAILKSPIGIAAVVAGVLITAAAAYQLKDRFWKK
jgi:hypothetical protein